MESLGDEPPCTILVDVRTHTADEQSAAAGVLYRAGQQAPSGGLRAVHADDPDEVPRDADMLWIDGADITHRPLIEACALTGLPVAISARGASLPEVTRAVGWHQLAFRHGEIPPCVSPLKLRGGGRVIVVHEPHAALHLAAIRRISERTMGPVGFKGAGEAAPLAVAAGASLIVLSPGPSLADELKAIAAAGAALGSPSLPSGDTTGRRSVVAATDLTAGSTLEPASLAFLDAGTVENSHAPFQAEALVGRVLLRDIRQGEVILKDDLEGPEPAPPPWFSPRPPKQKREDT